MKNFGLRCAFFSGMRFFRASRVDLLTGSEHSEAKMFATLLYWPWKHKLFLRLIIYSTVASFDRFDCFKEQASSHSPQSLRCSSDLFFQEFSRRAAFRCQQNWQCPQELFCDASRAQVYWRKKEKLSQTYILFTHIYT